MLGTNAVERHHLLLHAYCLMSNQYHLLVETPDANLSRAVRHINGTYTQAYNRTHHRVGPLLQGRFKANLVEKETYLLELVRYIVLNPVRARMAPTPDCPPGRGGPVCRPPEAKGPSPSLTGLLEETIMGAAPEGVS